jgi:hypothetical protein
MKFWPQFRRLAFFTRLLDAAPAAERYRLAAEQIAYAERFGFDAAWVAQHHFHEHEGGLPSPLVFLGHVAARTTRIRLGTGIITLPLEMPVRVAEDAIVLDLLSGGRLELGVGNGGNPAAFAGFDLVNEHRADLFARKFAGLRGALKGDPIPGGDTLYPQQPDLAERIWQATFSVAGGARAGLAGDGLMLSRTQPRPADNPRATLAELQEPIIDAYLAADGCRVSSARAVCLSQSPGPRPCVWPILDCGPRSGALSRVATGCPATRSLTSSRRLTCMSGHRRRLLPRCEPTARCRGSPTSRFRCTPSIRRILGSCGRSNWWRWRWHLRLVGSRQCQTGWRTGRSRAVSAPAPSAAHCRLRRSDCAR